MGAPTADQARRDRATGAAIAALAVSNVVANRILGEASYVPWNATLAAGLVAVARRGGCRPEDLGLDPDELARGLVVGAAGSTVVVVANGLVWRSRHGGTVFDDRRATELSTSTAWYQALVRIPIGTALVEEVAFRGVLPALLASPDRPRWVPGGVSSLLFGVWHVLPSLHLAGANQGAGRLAGRAGPAGIPLAAVAATTAAGAVLHRLRRHGRHLAAPVLVHVAANLAGFVGARLVGRQGASGTA